MAVKQVLIVGAGPTGLVLALFLARQGVRPRIVDGAAGPGLASRAMVVQARTLEFYRQIGIADDVVASGIVTHGIHLRRGDVEKAAFNFSDIGRGLSPYPFALTYPQDEHEKLLAEKLKDAGIDVEWGVDFVGMDERPDCIRTILRDNDTVTECDFNYVCGCDGAHSAVRRALDLQFPGGTYEREFFVADVAATGDVSSDHINMCMGAHQLCLVFPIRSSGMFRVIGMVPDEIPSESPIEFEAIRPIVEELAGIKIQEVNWFSAYRVHHRVTDHFQVGKAFIAGDAGHVHSPVGGQGMNTGIGDAVNLAWKLAAVLQERAAPTLLDTYEPERIAFAKSLVATTDRAFTAITGDNIGSQALRSLVAPHLVPFALGFTPVQKALFRIVSQTRINYHDSALSQGVVGDLQAGDRLPWSASGDLQGQDNFELLKSLDWQIHVYGQLTVGLREAAKRFELPAFELAWNTSAETAGFQQGAYYLIRPDGYIALAMPDQDTAALEAFVAKWRITPRAQAELATAH